MDLNLVKSTIEGKIIENNYILSDVLYEEEGKLKFLRIIVDKEERFINIDDCVFLNKLISSLLDDIDLGDDSYILDVCSKEKGSV